MRAASDKTAADHAYSEFFHDSALGVEFKFGGIRQESVFEQA